MTGGGSGWSRHRQQKRLEKKPLLLGFLEDREGEEPAGEEEEVTRLIYHDLTELCLEIDFYHFVTIN